MKNVFLFEYENDFLVISQIDILHIGGYNHYKVFTAVLRNPKDGFSGRKT